MCWSLFLIELTAWRPTTLSEKDSSTGVFAFCEFCEILRRAFLQKTSWRPLLKWRYFFFFLFADQWALQPKKIYLVGQCYIRQRNSQPFQFCVVMKISRELHLPSGYYDLLKGKEDNLWRALLSFVKITNFNMTLSLHAITSWNIAKFLRTPILKNI